ILKSDAESYAVYSFEPGSSKPASELDERELIEIATFAAALERVTPEHGELETAVGASFCVADHFKEIDARLRAFEEFAVSPDVYPEVRELCRDVDVRARLTELFAR